MREIIIDRAMTLVAVAGLALLVSGQAASQVARSHTPVTSGTNVRAAKTPYTAEYKITNVQALADGTTITREITEVEALDSQCRRMTATTVMVDRTPTTHVMVYDPVARTQTTWRSPGKIAHVFKMSTPGAEHTCSRMTRDDVSVVSGPKSKSTSENLGVASIQGVEARGRRTTTTIPAGAVGNEAPLVSTLEAWTALTVGLNGLLVREDRDDPRSGKTTRELTSLSQSDPDPTTFQPPEGYEIVTKDSSACQDETTAKAMTEATTSK